MPGGHHPQREADASAAVDALFDNNRCKRPYWFVQPAPQVAHRHDQGKQGRFRENLLGKRVDYSARSVIVVARTEAAPVRPAKKIALELFQPFIIRRLKELGHADTIKSAKKMLERRSEEVWISSRRSSATTRSCSIVRRPCTAWASRRSSRCSSRATRSGFTPWSARVNADFDGDQMAVHLPLSIEAQVEAMTLMMATNNIFSPPTATRSSADPGHRHGSYYLTVSRVGELGEAMVFATPTRSSWHTARARSASRLIKLRLPGHKRLKGTATRNTLPEWSCRHGGRVVFNDILHSKMPFYN